MENVHDPNKFYLVVKVSRWTKIRNFFIMKFAKKINKTNLEC